MFCLASVLLFSVCHHNNRMPIVEKQNKKNLLTNRQSVKCENAIQRQQIEN